MKEFTYISPNVVLDCKLATRVIFEELVHFKDVFVKDNQLLTIINFFLEFSCGHLRAFWVLNWCEVALSPERFVESVVH
jgi:hypothetical protein